MKATAKRVEEYINTGTGLETDKFRKLVHLENPPPPEDSARMEVDLENKDDSDYEEEENIERSENTVIFDPATQTQMLNCSWVFD